MCGRVTKQGEADSADPLPDPILQDDHVAMSDASGYAVALDAHGRLDWGARNDIGGDHVDVVLREFVPDADLRSLRAGAQSYLFAEETKVVFALALAKLRAPFGIERLLVKGGGHINGAMLKAGVIDELGLLLAPAVDGVTGTLALFDFSGEETDCMGGRCKMDLTSCHTLAGGGVWLRYRITPAAEAAFR
jgi:riboflavin biosynthesis pyrimidine reductase